jgi:hypothetical protein
MFLVKVFTEGKKVVGKAFLSKKMFVLKEKILFITMKNRKTFKVKSQINK